MALFALAFDAVCKLASLAGAAANLQALDRLGPGPVDIDAMPLWTSFVALISFVSLLITGIIVLTWIFRVCANGRALAPGMTRSPWGAVLWYFVPIATLWKPFESLADTWRASESPAHWQDIETPTIMRWWWGFWLLRQLFDNISGQIAMRVHEANAAGEITSFIGDGFALAATAVFVVIVRRITRMQVAARNQGVFD